MTTKTQRRRVTDPRTWFWASAAALLLWGLPVPGYATYDLVSDQYGVPLGLNYEKDGRSIRGELGIHRDQHLLLFVGCHDSQIRYGEEYMRRRNRNCQNQLARWPDNLISHVTAATTGPVTLTGPPSLCGPCMPAPFQGFDLPAGITVLTPEQVRQLSLPDISLTTDPRLQIQPTPRDTPVAPDASGVRQSPTGDRGVPAGQRGGSVGGPTGGGGVSGGGGGGVSGGGGGGFSGGGGGGF